MSNLEISRAERLDQYVIRQLPTLSRAAAVHLIDEGAVVVNGVAQLKAGYKLRPNDSIKIDYHAELLPVLPQIELPIVFENKDCVVINKPVGLLTHSKGAFNPEATVASWLGDHILAKSKPGVSLATGDRAGIVHRLDRATSGVMICAKTPEALAWLQKQFSQRNVKKTYVAIVEGVLEQEQAIIDMPIERNPKKPQTFRVGPNGKAAQTEYRVLQTSNTLSLLELKPTTGRTHQLRVHLHHLGHPILGDSFYGGKPAERLFLHAQSLEVTLPNKQRKVFEVPVPQSFEDAMAA